MTGDPIDHELQISEQDGVVVARLRGEIDVTNAGTIGAELTAAISNYAVGLVIDLAETEYLDSAGVNLMFELAERLADRQQKMRVAVPAGAPIRRVLEVVELGSLVPIATGTAKAIASLREGE